MSQDVTAELLAIRRRVLAYLEKQRAVLGVYTPPYIQIQIDETRREIEKLLHYSYIFTLKREVMDSERPQCMPGAILLVSREEIVPGLQRLTQAAFDAIAYHRATLRHCWLIGTTGDEGSLGAAAWLADHYRVSGIKADIWPIDDPSSIEEIFNAVQLLYADMNRDSGLGAHEVVADITGGTKPMSIGLLRACQGRSPVQYMVRQRDGSSLPILLSSAAAIVQPVEPRGVT